MDKNGNKKSFLNLIRENLQKIVIILISILYITQGMFELRKKDTTIIDIIGSISISIVVGTIISGNFLSMGLKAGRKSELFQGSMKAYGEAKANATPFFDKLSSWCEYKNDVDLENKKKNIIRECGLNWKAFKLGYYQKQDNYNKLTEKQKKALEDVKNCKISRLTYEDLLSDFPRSKKFSSKRFGENEYEYQFKKNTSDIYSKIIIGVVFGLYGLSPLFTKENTAEVIAGMLWNAGQIILWISFGIIKYVNALSFMEDTYRQSHIIQKTEYLNEFVITMKNNPDVITNYDIDNELDEYIKKYLDEKEKESNDE